MTDLYDREFDLVKTTSPLNTVAFHPAEDFTDCSLLSTYFRQYVRKGIKNLFGLNVTEFMELPRHITEMMFEIADEEASKKAKVVDELENEFK